METELGIKDTDNELLVSVPLRGDGLWKRESIIEQINQYAGFQSPYGVMVCGNEVFKRFNEIYGEFQSPYGVMVCGNGKNIWHLRLCQLFQSPYGVMVCGNVGARTNRNGN